MFTVALAMTGFGVFMALSSRSSAFDAFNQQIDPVFWPAGPDSTARDFQQMIYAVWGATVAGFGALAAFVVRHPFRARQRWARDALAVSILLWFVLDTTASAVAGVWFNVVFNTVVLGALAVPMAATWKEFG